MHVQWIFTGVVHLANNAEKLYPHHDSGGFLSEPSRVTPAVILLIPSPLFLMHKLVKSLLSFKELC